MEIIEILKAVLFGIVEGITEWLPISSTGHMILLNEIMPLKVSDEFYSMLEVVIQLGAIMAVVILFWDQIWPFGKKNNNEPLTKKWIGAWIKTDIFKLWFHILIGVFQVIAAIFPGTSRSGATIVGALLIGVSRTVAAEYTFFLAIPVMFGASLLKIWGFGLHFSLDEAVILIVGMVVAFVVSLIVIQFLMGYIKKHDFKVFGWYRIVLGAIVLICGILGAIHG